MKLSVPVTLSSRSRVTTRNTERSSSDVYARVEVRKCESKPSRITVPQPAGQGASFTSHQLSPPGGRRYGDTSPKFGREPFGMAANHRPSASENRTREGQTRSRPPLPRSSDGRSHHEPRVSTSRRGE